MAANTNRFSTYTTASTGTDSRNGDRPEKKSDLWSSMLDSVASGKRLPEKNILLFGGTVDSQREFFESLSNNDLRRASDRHGSRVPPVANSFALGYAYYDVLDADQEDTLARVSLYTLTTPSPAFAPLLVPLFTPQFIQNSLLVVLLDWSQPWSWMRQLKEWFVLLRHVLNLLKPDVLNAIEEQTEIWKDRGRGNVNLDGTTIASAVDGEVAMPLGPGEWEHPLGLPTCVVCQNAEKMEYLEKTQGWKEEEFDAVLQFLRTALLRHGASLIYTTPSAPSQLPTLIHSTLGVHSLLKKQPLKHNVIDRDKIVVPPNWDSWGKIRVLREGFDVEKVNEGWLIDLNFPFADEEQKEELGEDGPNGDPQDSTVAMYEQVVQDPTMDALQIAGRNMHSTKLEVEAIDTQTFLGQQYRILEQIRQKMEDVREKREKTGKPLLRLDDDEFGGVYPNRPITEAKVLEHIGPVQFNVGGIHVDADDMVQRLKDREKDRRTYGSSPEPTSPDSEHVIESAPQMDTENLQAFFTGLMSRRGGPTAR